MKDSSSSSCLSTSSSSLSPWNFHFDSAFIPPNVCSSGFGVAQSHHYGGASSSSIVASCNPRSSSNALPDPIGYSFINESFSDASSPPLPSTSSFSPFSSTTSYLTELFSAAEGASPASSSSSILHRRRGGGSSSGDSSTSGGGGGASSSAASAASLHHSSARSSSGGNWSIGSSSSPAGPVELSASNLEIIYRRSWEASISPLKSLGMPFVMMYMSGASSGIFGILIIGYALMNTVKSLLAVSSVFRPYDNIPGMRSAVLQKSVYVTLCGLGLTYVLYYCNSLGLLPVNSGDYVGLIPEKRIVERSAGVVL